MSDSCSTKPKGLRASLKSWSLWKIILGIVLGGIAGFLYYHFYGCESGTCAITSSPVSSVIFGSLMGFFIVAKPCSTC